MSTSFSSPSVKQKWEARIQACQQELMNLAEALPQSLDDLPNAEQAVREAVLQLGRTLLQTWCETADARTPAPNCSCCERPMRHKGYVKGPLVTTLGNVHLRRIRFRCETCGEECYPHDERLKVAGHNLSRTLAKVVGRMGAQLPFDQARQTLEWDYGVHLSKQTVQLVTEDAGLAVLEHDDRQRRHVQELPPAEQWEALPESDLSPEKLYLYADGTMIHTEGDWHEIRVAKVVAVDSNDNRLSVDQQARFLSCEDFAWQLSMIAHAGGYRHAASRAFIADGARWLWIMADMHFPEATQILDWYHLSEHIHATAAVLYGEGSCEARRFSDKRLNELWEGRAGPAIKHLATLRKQMRSPPKRESLRKLITYLQNNRSRINYPRYRRLGLAVGSGPVESACKTLVGARCKQSGMRNWTRRGAEGVLRLRAALQTGRYDALWQSA